MIHQIKLQKSKDTATKKRKLEMAVFMDEGVKLMATLTRFLTVFSKPKARITKISYIKDVKFYRHMLTEPNV